MKNLNPDHFIQFVNYYQAQGKSIIKDLYDVDENQTFLRNTGEFDFRLIPLYKILNEYVIFSRDII